MTRKIYYIIIFMVALLINCNLHSQNKIEDLFDNTVGKENLPLNNGVFYFNTFKTFDTHQFYSSNKYSSEALIYDNQFYNSVNLKYDSYQDALVFKPYGESENFGIVLVQQKVSKFTLNNKNFVNLNLTTNKNLTDIKGYYEENWRGKNFIFYIKHKKTRRELIKNQTSYTDFEIYNEFLIFKNNLYYSVESKNNLINLFPILKKEIKTFYSDNSKLLKNNKTEFFEKLLRFIDQLTFT
ncbi:hypothetical protein [Flavobacterium cucumis]|uniref:Uncharacterized protein n=1 Tax=Flavobacterium cucumis TaxID=416016 RepID=A0A1M7ZSU0_9FLAO|nr:hypothetical protein [Flavobacterium cucumis]SHO71946.1 hypothetical protein SAMN05443547_0265 [Flavobacterium cucumis]